MCIVNTNIQSLWLLPAPNLRILSDYSVAPDRLLCYPGKGTQSINAHTHTDTHTHTHRHTHTHTHTDHTVAFIYSVICRCEEYNFYGV